MVVRMFSVAIVLALLMPAPAHAITADQVLTGGVFAGLCFAVVIIVIFLASRKSGNSQPRISQYDIVHEHSDSDSEASGVTRYFRNGSGVRITTFNDKSHQPNELRQKFSWHLGNDGRRVIYWHGNE